MTKPNGLTTLLGAAALLAVGTGTAAAQQMATAPMPAGGIRANGSIEQQQQATGLPGVNAQQDAFNRNGHEVFRLLGLSGDISAPVTPSYNGDVGYRTFAGQPMRGRDATLAQGMDGSP